MGNCSPKCVVSGDHSNSHYPNNSIRVLTDSGSILEFKGPKILASQVLDSYPGYGIFRQGQGSSPVPDGERLLSGKFYYLLPLGTKEEQQVFNGGKNKITMEADEAVADTKKSAILSINDDVVATELVGNLAKGSALEVLPSGADGVWRVKLMIDPKQLGEILSEQGNTEALIEQMRTLASSAATLTPRHSKSTWKSNFSSFFKLPPSADQNRRESFVNGYLQC